MENDQEMGSNSTSCNAVSRRLGEALQKLESAGALISLLIKDELTRSKDHQRLERLYSVKGSVTCAIEETRKRQQSIHAAASSNFMINNCCSRHSD